MPDLSKITNIEDLRVLAERRVPRMFYDYADSGSWTEGTYRANEADFHTIKLRQRVAVNMENRSTAVTMAGQAAKMPVVIAPVGLTGMQHADGEIHAARAAEKFGIPFTLSTMSICSIEDIAEHTSAPFWFQLYMMRDREAMVRMIERARAAKCSALVLTLDLQVIGQRHKDIKNGLTAPPRPTLRNIINLATKPRWCLGMMGTKRHTFRNLVGHVKGVSDMNSLAAWTNEQFDPRLSWEDVAKHAGEGFWFQLYVMKDRGFIERLIDRAKAAHCGALVLTLDLQILHKELDVTMAFCGHTNIQTVDRNILLPGTLPG